MAAQDDICSALCAPGGAGADLHPFGQFIGVWDVDVTDFRADRPHKMSAVWTFAAALESRAVVDVWSVAGYECGMSIRFYDPAIDAWRSTWHGPQHGLVATFVAREMNDEIVLQATQSAMSETSWIFSQITPASFHWRMLVGSTVAQTMSARRRT